VLQLSSLVVVTDVDRSDLVSTRMNGEEPVKIEASDCGQGRPLSDSELINFGPVKRCSEELDLLVVVHDELAACSSLVNVFLNKLDLLLSADKSVSKAD